VVLEQNFAKLLVAHYSLQNGTNPKEYLQKMPQDLPNRKILEQVFAANVAKIIPAENRKFFIYFLFISF
jgi:hypothetical protein